MKVVRSENAPEPLGPYSQGIVENGFVFVAGTIAIDPREGKMVEGGIEEQTARVLENVKAVLEEAGSSLAKVTKVTVFIRDGSLFRDMNEVYAKFFGDHRPARSTVVVGFPREDILVEIEAIASR